MVIQSDSILKVSFLKTMLIGRRAAFRVFTDRCPHFFIARFAKLRKSAHYCLLGNITSVVGSGSDCWYLYFRPFTDPITAFDCLVMVTMGDLS